MRGHLHIQIFDESDIIFDERSPAFRPSDFGGAIPQVGDLIALPTALQDFDHNFRENPRMRKVVERYFWLSSDPKTPTRICLLVQERRGRRSPGKRVVSNTRAVARASQAADIPFIIQQIYTCLRAAKESDDEEMAAALQKLAKAFADRAIALGADPSTIPRSNPRGSG